MAEKERVYICIDLKSFYASVECRERGLDPMTTNLVVADPERTEKTICLAVSPAMKAQGVPGRCRVFQIPADIPYIMAPPRMQLYIAYSAKIYGIYLHYIAKEDMHVYSIDEVFMDVTDYLSMYRMSAKALSETIMKDVYRTTGITASAGIGPNLYLAKIAMDLLAKYAPDHIGILDEETYRRLLWRHRPLTDFWRIGGGISRRLAAVGITTMEEIAQAREEVLYRLFGVDAELLIDHAWGRETVTMADIKAYRPEEHSLSSGQVLCRDYDFSAGRLVAKEMADMLCMELVEKDLVTSSITLHVGYARSFAKKPAHGTIHLYSATSSSREMIAGTAALYDRIVDPRYAVRRISLTFPQVTSGYFRQYDLFSEPKARERERCLQKAVLEVKQKYGKNAVVKGMNLEEKATGMERNRQIGGHRSGT